MSNHNEIINNIEGGSIYCEITGYNDINDGKPIVFVLAGGPGFSHTTYKNNQSIMSLQEHTHLVFFDPANCGESQGFNNEDCDLDLYIKIVEGIRQYFNFDEIVLLGTSYGAMAAMGYAVTHPDNLNGLILVAGAPSYHFLEKAKENLQEKGTEEQINICNKKLWPGKFNSSNDVQEFLGIMTSLYSNKAKNQNNTEPYKSNDYQFPYELLNVAFGQDFWEFDYTDKLGNITCETTIIVGEDDWINDPSFAEQMYNGIENSTLHIIENSGHSVSYDQPVLYQTIISNFLQQLWFH